VGESQSRFKFDNGEINGKALAEYRKVNFALEK
jgi:hypothetical protein